MKRIILALAVMLSACQPMPDQEVIVDTTDVPPAVAVYENATAAECAARGGRMTPQGRMQTMQCLISYADAGKRCTTGSDCLGDCRAEPTATPVEGATVAGRCQADSGRFGCYTTVEGGKARATICVD